MSLKEVDFEAYSRFPQEQVTKWMYEVGQALRDDYRNHGNKFTVYRVTNDIANYFPDIGNKQALKRGERAGEILNTVGHLNDTGYSLIRGADLARTISYFFQAFPLRSWENLKDTVKEFGPEWAKLTELTVDPSDDVLTRFREEMNAINPEVGGIAARLREIAQIIEPLERKNKHLTKQVEQQNLTILSTTNEKTRLQVEKERLQTAINRMRSSLNELLQRIQQEQNPEKRADMVKKYQEFQDKLDKTLE